MVSNTKKILLVLIPVLLIAVLVLVVSEVGKKNNKKVSVKKKELISIGFSQVGAESDWRSANSISIKNAFKESAGYDLIFEDARQLQENQIKSVREFIQQDVDYIIIAPVVEEGWETVLEEAKAAEIPVLVIDRKVDVDDSLYSTWIGSDFYNQGVKACQAMEAYIEEKSIKNPNIVHIQGTIGATAQIGRSSALEDAAEKYGWNIIVKKQGEYTQAKSKELMEGILKKNKDIDFVYCENDNEAFGVIEAIEEAGLTVGPEGDIKIVSFDATYEGLKNTLEGKILINVECNPLQGPVAEEMIEKLEKGKTIDKEVVMEEQVFVYGEDIKEIEIEDKKIVPVEMTEAVLEERNY